MSGKGKTGEDIAAGFLEEKGMKIIKRNFRSRAGEIDIIAVDNDVLVFIEVKNWTKYNIDALEQAINRKKQNKIIETSKYFLCLHREYRYMAIRFDIIFISSLEKPGDESAGIRHLASVFTECV